MSRADLAKVLPVLVAHEKRALGRAHSASSANIARRAAVQASGYTARRQEVEQLLNASFAAGFQPR
jgi:hypothetical protein